MTNQEARAQLEEINREVHIYSEAVDMAIKALKAQEWVPRKERLPKKDGSYLVSGK